MIKKLDFLLVGFEKSGTTSVDAILRQDRRILLSNVKETKFIKNKGGGQNGNLNKFWDTYYPKTWKNKCAGGMEPSYCFEAKQVADIFGRELKLIFMMRNPVLANYSKFKMMLRGQGDSEIDRLYRKYTADELPQMYDVYIRRWLNSAQNDADDDFLYDKWIDDYLRYYDKEQMMFILFEDFIADPQKTIRNIEEFLGFTPRNLNCEIRENKDKGISKNFTCRTINKTTSTLYNRWNGDVRIKSLLGRLRETCYPYTLVQNKAKMDDKTEKRLRNHYKTTISYVEQLLERDLKGIWY